MATKRKTNKELTRRTISEELLKQWKKLTRTGDALVLAEKLGVSKPTIDKAIIYGCVHKQSTIDGINKFFADRLMAEKETAVHLENLRLQKTQTV